MINARAIKSVALGSKSYSNNNGRIKIPVSFSREESPLTFTFEEGFAEPLTIAVKYIKAYKKAYDEKVLKQLQEKYKKEISVVLRVGQSLLNVHWKNVSVKSRSTEIKLYAIVKGEELIMEEAEVSSSKLYYAFTNLAYGDYKIIITQKIQDGLSVSDSFNFTIENEAEKIIDMIKSIPVDIADM